MCGIYAWSVLNVIIEILTHDLKVVVCVKRFPGVSAQRATIRDMATVCVVDDLLKQNLCESVSQLERYVVALY